jgi:hypothetical protein
VDSEQAEHSFVYFFVLFWIDMVIPADRRGGWEMEAFGGGV